MNQSSTWNQRGSWSHDLMPQVFQVSMNEALEQSGLVVQIYAPASALLPDLNRVPAPYVLQNAHLTLQAMFITDEEAQEAAMTLGIDAQRVANAYLQAAADGLLFVRGILLDSRGRYWLMHQAPIPYEDASTVIGVKVLCIQQLQKPAGLP